MNFYIQSTKKLYCLSDEDEIYINTLNGFSL